MRVGENQEQQSQGKRGRESDGQSAVFCLIASKDKCQLLGLKEVGSGSPKGFEW